jgi:hypothetical protein
MVDPAAELVVEDPADVEEERSSREFPVLFRRVFRVRGSGAADVRGDEAVAHLRGRGLRGRAQAGRSIAPGRRGIPWTDAV